MSSARDAAVKAVAEAQSNGAADPLGAFTTLTQADADLDRLLAEVAEEREATERLNKSYDQALFTAQSRVRSVSDYIDTRRGSIGPEARTRLNEAVRQLEAAQSTRKTDINEAIRRANGASMLAAQASTWPTTTSRPASASTRPTTAAASPTWARWSAASSSATSSEAGSAVDSAAAIPEEAAGPRRPTADRRAATAVCSAGVGGSRQPLPAERD